MNTIFIIYTCLVVVAIAIISAAVILSTFKRVLKWKEWVLIASGALCLSIGVALNDSASKINTRLKTEFKVPKDFYSDAEYATDSTINDTTLYGHMLLMRVSFPEVILCQAKIESAQYSSDLFKRNNNLFGMKNSTSRVTTVGQGRAGYKWYPTWKESVTDYALWQLSHNVDKMTQSEYISYLGKIYAEDPNYTKKIREMLKKIDFEKLGKYEK